MVFKVQGFAGMIITKPLAEFKNQIEKLYGSRLNKVVLWDSRLTLAQKWR